VAQRKLIIQVRLNEGMSKEGNSHTPYSPEEIARAAIDCYRAGASVVHYHARDPDTGAPSSSIELYAEVVRQIKQECDLIIMPTLGASALPTAEERLAQILVMAKDPLTKPDAIPVDMLTSNMDRYDPAETAFITEERIYMNTTKMLKHLCTASKKAGVKPAAMMWDVSGVRLTTIFVELGLFEEPLFCECALFRDGFESFGHPATADGLEALLRFMPAGSDWQWFADTTGGNDFPVATLAMARGGHVCVGLGSHHYAEFGHPTNAGLVKRTVELAKLMNRAVATTTEAREMLGYT
jgi:uncharacterized protein (DUF849 family)